MLALLLLLGSLLLLLLSRLEQLETITFFGFVAELLEGVHGRLGLARCGRRVLRRTGRGQR